MQMIGRAARQEGEEANVDVLLSTQLYHWYLNKMQRSSDEEDAELKKQSLTCLYNALQPGRCKWKGLLSFFGEHVRDDWTCETKCGHCSGDEGSQSNEILEHPSLNTILKTINMVPNIHKTVLSCLLLSTPSAMEKVPIETQNAFFQCKDANFKKMSKLKSATEFIESLQAARLITLEIIRTQRSAVLRLTEKGLSMINEHKRDESTTHDCQLPSLEMMKECPCPAKEFSLPNEEDLQKIHASDEMTDELFEVCLRIPILKGHVVLDLKEENRRICVPKKIIAEVWCQEHKKTKEGYAAALAPFHRYPNYMSWTVHTRWKNTNTFNDSLVGFNIDWRCSHRSYGCAVQKKWKSISEEKHNDDEHVIFEEEFDTIGTVEEDIRLNRHIHPCGSKVQNRQRKVVSNACCLFNTSVVPAEFRYLMTEEELPQKNISQPVFSYMEQLFENYSQDPVRAQINSTETYGKARNIQHSINVSKRPWLAASQNASAMSAFNRVERLQEYIDKLEHKQEKDQCPSYIGPMIRHKHEVFTIICTDLFGITLFTLATKKKDAVISIDGTGEKNKKWMKLSQNNLISSGVGRQDAKNLMMYSVTVDTKVGCQFIFEKNTDIQKTLDNFSFLRTLIWGPRSPGLPKIIF